jgi:hypothetical protein
MIEAVRSSETSVNIYQTTRRNILEDSHLHTRRRENLKFHHLLFAISGVEPSGYAGNHSENPFSAIVTLF